MGWRVISRHSSRRLTPKNEMATLHSWLYMSLQASRSGFMVTIYA